MPKCYAYRSSLDTRVNARDGTGVVSTKVDRLKQSDIVVVYSKHRHQRIMWAARVAHDGMANLQDAVEVPAEPCFSYLNLKVATGAEKLHDGRAVEDERMVSMLLALWNH